MLNKTMPKFRDIDMEKISRRKFIYFITSLSLFCPLSTVIASSKENKNETNSRFPITIAVLKSGYKAEKLASEKYISYSRKAVEEKYPNIAYLFAALSASENIHAQNYKRILKILNTIPEEPEFEVQILDTKANLINASEAELNKIKKIYPDFLMRLKKESYKQAVVNCMYSWESHQQHIQDITKVRKYSKAFFGLVAKKIENMKLDFHVCRICGSTIDEAPKASCEICNYPSLHYDKIIRPI